MSAGPQMRELHSCTAAANQMASPSISRCSRHTGIARWQPSVPCRLHLREPVQSGTPCKTSATAAVVLHYCFSGIQPGSARFTEFNRLAAQSGQQTFASSRQRSCPQNYHCVSPTCACSGSRAASAHRRCRRPPRGTCRWGSRPPASWRHLWHPAPPPPAAPAPSRPPLLLLPVAAPAAAAPPWNRPGLHGGSLALQRKRTLASCVQQVLGTAVSGP